MCYNSTEGYINLIIPLLRRMLYLEELNLYIHILCGPIFISGTNLDNEILIYMSRLQTFTFHIVSENTINDQTLHISESDIQETFTNVKYQQVACMINNVGTNRLLCRVFTLPVKFDRLIYIGSNIPNIIFNSVTCLKIWDKHPLKYEFFFQLARCFPFLKNLSIWNLYPPTLKFDEFHFYNNDWYSLIQYPYLISLDIERISTHYVENFLNETQIYLPRLSELKIHYGDLAIITDNFTRSETRRNCANIKKLIMTDCKLYTEDIYSYFPLLSH